MKELGSLAAVLAVTLALLVGLFALRPFDVGSSLLDRAFGATPAWTQVGRLIHDPKTQELSRGDAPLESFAILGKTWGARPDAKKVLIVGNSQTMAVSLAPGEDPPTGEEPTWTDLVTAHFADRALVYRLSAPGVSYPEALFYIEYLAQHPELRPDVMVIQLNYQSFWNGGIRGGMFQLLDDPAFRAAIEKEAKSDAPYADAFGFAIHEHDAHPRKESAEEHLSIGMAADQAVRGWLDRIPAFAARHGDKEDLADMLYRMRIYFLRLRPTTARTIAGTRFVQARASIQAILDFCRREHIQPVLFLAPVNPRLNLYRTSDDKARFMGLVEDLEKAGTPIEHLEDAIPAEHWGRQFDGPDPLHLGRRGHAELAKRMIPAISKALEGSRGVQ